MLYVSRLKLHNIRCFEELDISFEAKQRSALLIGDNGDGKSTVLRSLAMGICDQSSAAALFRELPGDYVRQGADVGTIEVELRGDGSYRYRIVTTIKTLEAFERVEQQLFRLRGHKSVELHQDNFPWQRIFASGYGPGLRVLGSGDYDYYLTVDSVYSLFRYDVTLHNPELVIRRLADEQGGSKARAISRKLLLGKLKELLKKLLQLDSPSRIELTPTGLYLRVNGATTDLASTGDGYRATITWVLDLIAWWLLKIVQTKARFQADKIAGIVMVDEIEQHLHPRWQRQIMHLLTSSFPEVQFIATTHSPLVASGCANIPVHRLKHDEHATEEPFGWLAEDVYRFMGVESSRAKAFHEDVLTEFEELDMKRLSGAAKGKELRRLREIQKQLERLPGTDPIRLSTEIRNLRKQLAGLKKKRK